MDYATFDSLTPLNHCKGAIMELQILLLSLFVALFFPLLVLGYLRKVLRSLLSSVCGSSDAADFWFRCIQILAVSGSVILVIGLVPTYSGVNWLQVIRSTLIWTSIGIFAAVAIVANSVWSNIVRPALVPVNKRSTSTLTGEIK
jgi:D-alanyl-lipoteichoic acid acyltransferase DltB (MBOAT superfamily)